VEGPAKKRFVIHKHTHGKDIHWDLMIEQENCLKTWRLEVPPEKLATQKTKATPIFDHNKKFLTYQGPVNNGKGDVEIVDEGFYTTKSADENQMNINFEGKIVRGNYYLTQINGDFFVCPK